jgi:hypothetical protein
MFFDDSEGGSGHKYVLLLLETECQAKEQQLEEQKG